MTWRPIKTAPRDGSPIWGFLHETGILLLRWATPEECAAEEGGDASNYDGCFVQVSDFDEEWSPAWWLPLDALPLPPGTVHRGLSDALAKAEGATP